jgi:hypothetical protein
MLQMDQPQYISPGTYNGRLGGSACEDSVQGEILVERWEREYGSNVLLPAGGEAGVK